MTYAGRVKNQSVNILVDSGASGGNFISSAVAARLRLSSVEKARHDKIQPAHEKILTSSRITSLTPFELSTFKDTETFHIVDIPGVEVVLGLPWLKRANPSIDWKSGLMTLKDHGTTQFVAPKHDTEKRQLIAMFLSPLQMKKAIRQNGSQA